MRWLLVVGAALALVPAASGGLPNPCALLTDVEAGKALGGKVSDRSPRSDRSSRTCTWSGPNQGGFFQNRPTLTVQVIRLTKAQFEHGAERTTHAVRVRGVGEVAYSIYMGGGFLYAWQHGYSLFVAISPATDPIATETSVAKIIVKRL